MKKIFCLLCVIVLIISLGACGHNVENPPVSTNNDNNTSTPTEQVTSGEETVPSTPPEPEQIVKSDENYDYISQTFGIEKEWLIVDRDPITTLVRNNEKYDLSDSLKYGQVPNLVEMEGCKLFLTPGEECFFSEYDIDKNNFAYSVKNTFDKNTALNDCSVKSIRYGNGVDWTLCGIKLNMTIEEIKNVLGEPSFFSQADNGNFSMSYYYPLWENYMCLIYENIADIPAIIVSWGTSNAVRDDRPSNFTKEEIDFALVQKIADQCLPINIAEDDIKISESYAISEVNDGTYEALIEKDNNHYYLKITYTYAKEPLIGDGVTIDTNEYYYLVQLYNTEYEILLVDADTFDYIWTVLLNKNELIVNDAIKFVDNNIVQIKIK